MVSPKDLHVTTPDAALRATELAAYSESGRPLRRPRTTRRDGVRLAQSARHHWWPEPRAGNTALTWKDWLRSLRMPTSAASRCWWKRSRPGQCDVVQTLAEAAAIVKEIDNPGVRTMFDTHNAIDEAEPHAILLDRHYGCDPARPRQRTRRPACGAGSYDFKPILSLLQQPRLPRLGFARGVRFHSWRGKDGERFHSLSEAGLAENYPHDANT